MADRMFRAKMPMSPLQAPVPAPMPAPRPPAPPAMPKYVLPAFAVLGVLLLASVASAGFFFYQLKSAPKNPQAQVQAEADDLIAKVGKLIELPSDEKPTIATVSDPTKLADQPFFANAKAGDKVLIYATAKKAILYDPAENKIVDVAPVNLGQTAPPAPAAAKTASSTTKP